MRAYLSDKFNDERLADYNTVDKDWNKHYHAIDKEVSDVLERLNMIGRLSADPLIIGLLVPFENAYEEVKYQMERPELTKSQFQKILEKNEIYNLPTIDKLIELKDRLSKGNLSSREKNDMTMRLEKLAKALGVSESRICIKKGRMVIEGKSGQIYLLGDSWYLELISASKRLASSASKQLSFMVRWEPPRAMDSSDISYRAVYKLDTDPTSEEAEIVRKVAGLKKARTSAHNVEVLAHNDMVSAI